MKQIGGKHGKWPPSSPSTVSQKGVSLKRRNVIKALSKLIELSSELYKDLKAENPGDSLARFKALCNAAKIMSDKHECENAKKRVGAVEGIEIGDKFQYRAELVVIGLHHPHTGGIDYMGKGENSLATSIVVTKRYDNTLSDGSLVYIGEGGRPHAGRNVLAHDQKMEGGNLALKNSMDARKPVRVILKVSEKSDGVDELVKSVDSSSFPYIYDGLYLVTDLTEEKGNNGKLEFKFTLNRMSSQAPTCVVHGHSGLDNRSKGGGCSAQKEEIRRNDVSEGKEKFEIRLMAPRGYAELPPPFDYIINNVVYSGRCNLSLMQLPNLNDSLVQFQLAIFKTGRKGWGVKTRSYILAGSFVCEFVGEVYDHNGKDRLRLGVHPIILDMGAGKGFIDATRRGNVARFINHSCTPNLCVKYEVYVNGDERLPHMMLYAVRNIPAGRELTLDYNSCNGKLIKADEIKCYCASQECKGQI